MQKEKRGEGEREREGEGERGREREEEKRRRGEETHKTSRASEINRTPSAVMSLCDKSSSVNLTPFHRNAAPNTKHPL